MFSGCPPFPFFSALKTSRSVSPTSITRGPVIASGTGFLARGTLACKGDARLGGSGTKDGWEKPGPFAGSEKEGERSVLGSQDGFGEQCRGAPNEAGHCAVECWGIKGAERRLSIKTLTPFSERDPQIKGERRASGTGTRANKWHVESFTLWEVLQEWWTSAPAPVF